MPTGSLYKNDFAPAERDAALVRRDFGRLCCLCALGLLSLFLVGWPRPRYLAAPLEAAAPAWLAMSLLAIGFWVYRVRSLLAQRCAAKMHEQWLAIPRAPRPLLRHYLRRQAAMLPLFVVLAPLAALALSLAVHVWISIGQGWSFDGAIDRFERAMRSSDWPVGLLIAGALAQFAALPIAVAAIAPVARGEALQIVVQSDGGASDADELETWDQAARGSMRGVRDLGFDLLVRKAVFLAIAAAGACACGFGFALLLSPQARLHFPRMPSSQIWGIAAAGMAVLACAGWYLNWTARIADKLNRDGE